MGPRDLLIYQEATMWFFNSPEVIFGEDALSYLEEIKGHRAFIVTDANVLSLGFPVDVASSLQRAGLEVKVFADIEPEPSLQTVRRGAEMMQSFAPDWVVGVGGGSVMDAAKAMWILYEHPEINPAAISPIERIPLRRKARLICVPTTAGTGAEVTWAMVLTDQEEGRKLGLGVRDALADIAIVDPRFTMHLPSSLTAATGMDVLTHAVEGYSSTWANDFTDGLCLQAARMVFEYLPRAVEKGASDPEAREKMANAATIAGLGFGNSMAALAHAMGHSAGAVLHIHHGRVVGLLLPYTIEFVANQGVGRYADLARWLELPASNEQEAAASLARAIRDLARRIGEPLSLQDAGVDEAVFRSHLERLCDLTEADPTIVTSRRIPDRGELCRLFEYVYAGRPIDF